MRLNKSIMLLTSLHGLRVSRLLEDRKGLGEREEDGPTADGGSEEVLCFCVSINVSVVKCVQGRIQEGPI